MRIISTQLVQDVRRFKKLSTEMRYSQNICSVNSIKHTCTKLFPSIFIRKICMYVYVEVIKKQKLLLSLYRI